MEGDDVCVSHPVHRSVYDDVDLLSAAAKIMEGGAMGDDCGDVDDDCVDDDCGDNDADCDNNKNNNNDKNNSDGNDDCDNEDCADDRCDSDDCVDDDDADDCDGVGVKPQRLRSGLRLRRPPECYCRDDEGDKRYRWWLLMVTEDRGYDIGVEDDGFDEFRL